MTTYLDDVLDPALLAQMMDEGYVQVRCHPDYPYVIYCYTKQAMFDRKWNDVTKVCRGLIVNENTGEVLARPFKKFFNHGEPDAPVFGDTDWVTVFDKLDGSLGIAYDTPDGPAIATKGSFTSEQAVKATELLRAKYPRYQHDDITTDLFEIIYPDNRIVIDYGDEESLRYLGSVDIEDGSDYWNGILMRLWDIPCNHCLDSGPFYQLDLNLNRPNSEGFVLFNDDTGDRLKMKQEDYIELHRVMTGLNERQLWEWLSSGRGADEILTDLPEEIHDWAGGVLLNLGAEFAQKKETVVHAYCGTDPTDERKFFAQYAMQFEPWITSGLFLMLDHKDDRRLDEHIWKQVRP